jgi:hypothetical protein
MRAVSLIRAWVYGIGLFTAVTLSLSLAFAIAITGPPTRSELDNLQVFLSAVARDMEPAVEQAGAELCVQLPRDVTGSLCPDVAAAETPAAEPAVYEEAHAEAPPPSQEEIAARVVVSEPLLGGVESAPPRRTERVRVQERPERRARVTAARERRAARPPIVSPRNEPTPPLEDVGERALADLHEMTAQEIAAREAPSQNEASPAEEQETYNDAGDAAYDEDAAYEEERAYEEEQRWREERRRYRQWRRRQAYYERGERSGGW